jgi:arylsulfatase A-like enzyme
MTTNKNILFIFTDQHRCDAVGAYGAPVCKTPHIDTIAERGVTFDRAYTTCSVCSPARGTVMTGQYPHTHKVTTNVHGPGCRLSEFEVAPHILSEQLRQAGYNLGYAGKWHLGVESLPKHFGFEGHSFPGHGGGGFKYPEFIDYLKANGLSYGIEETMPSTGHRGGVIKGPVEATVPYFLAEEAVGQMDRFAEDFQKRQKPFFIWCNFWGPHPPYLSTQEYVDMYKDIPIPEHGNFRDDKADKPEVHRQVTRPDCADRPWAFWENRIRLSHAFTTMIDDQIGRMLRHLSELGLDDDTVIIFAADHGDALGMHGGLMDKCYFMYEETYRIPLIVAAPGMRRGQRDARFASSADIMPTILQAAGIAAPKPVQGTSLYPLLDPDADEVTWRDHVVSESHGMHLLVSQRMIRFENYKYVFNATDIDEFYDLEKGPWETDNLIDSPVYRSIRHDMMRMMHDWMRETQDRLRGPFEWALEREGIGYE